MQKSKFSFYEPYKTIHILHYSLYCNWKSMFKKEFWKKDVPTANNIHTDKKESFLFSFSLVLLSNLFTMYFFLIDLFECMYYKHIVYSFVRKSCSKLLYVNVSVPAINTTIFFFDVSIYRIIIKAAKCYL